ncbi:MAG: sigma-70 family RNA polymerase sigma factor [Solirubrobacteraceae bacterium]
MATHRFRSEEGDDLATLGETIGSEDGRYELVDADLSVAEAIRHLSQRECTILRLRFLGEMTQTEIAAELGVSQMQVSRLLRRALERLRGLVEVGDPERARDGVHAARRERVGASLAQHPA